MIKKHLRALHQIPEESLLEFKTKAYILNELAKYDLIVKEVSVNSIVALYDNGCDSSIAFRCDMDALPVLEDTNLEYKSTNGFMHACGHDGHMSMMLALIDYVTKNKFSKNLVFIFQESEETNGGALNIIESGILDEYNVEAIYGYHVWPSLSCGTIASIPGPMMASANEITITVNGVSCHCGTPELGVDALKIGAEVLTNIYKADCDISEKHILRFGTFNSGTVMNVISGKTVITGSIRTFTPECLVKVKEIIATEADKFKEVEVFINRGYKSVINNNRLFNNCKIINHVLDKPVMIAEDFSFYGEKYPSLFMFLGVKTNEALHSPKFVLDVESLEYGLQGYINLLSDFILVV